MDVKRAADLYAQGWTLRQIGAELVPVDAVAGDVVGQLFRLAHSVDRSVPAPRYRCEW